MTKTKGCKHVFKKKTIESGFECKDGRVLWEVMGLIAPEVIEGNPSFIHKLAEQQTVDEEEYTGGITGLARDLQLMNQMFEDGISFDRIAKPFRLSRSKVVYAVDKYRSAHGLIPRQMYVHGTDIETIEHHKTIALLRKKGKKVPAIAHELIVPDKSVRNLFARLKKKEKYAEFLRAKKRNGG